MYIAVRPPLKVFTYMTDKDGVVVNAKARLVAKGFSQVQDDNSFQMFARTPSAASVNILADVLMSMIDN